MVCEIKKRKINGNIITYEYCDSRFPSDVGVIEVDISKEKNWNFIKKVRNNSDILGYEDSRRISRMFREDSFPDAAYICE